MPFPKEETTPPVTNTNRVIEDSAAAPELRRRAQEALVELYVRVVDFAREETA